MSVYLIRMVINNYPISLSREIIIRFLFRFYLDFIISFIINIISFITILVS